MSKTGKERMAEAGARNLAKWLEKNPSGGGLRHGAHSRHVRKRYGDLRTREGKQLAATIGALINDLGGESTITAAQRLILDNIRAKMVVILQIAKYIDEQPSIINSKGELLPCLGRNYTTYAEGLRRDLEALFAIKRKPASQSYEKVLKSLEVE